MFDQIFDDPLTLFYGALTGFLFGFLLVKGGVTRYQVILGQFLLKDFTVLKVMGTAIVVGAVGVFGMRAMGMDVSISVRNALVVGNVVGGLIFGAGMAILGYCPGTAMASVGDGSRHAIFGILGGIVGAGLYAEAYPMIGARFVDSIDLGRVSLDSAAGLSPWWVILIMATIAVIGFPALERWERRQPKPRRP